MPAAGVSTGLPPHEEGPLLLAMGIVCAPSAATGRGYVRATLRAGAAPGATHSPAYVAMTSRMATAMAVW